MAFQPWEYRPDAGFAEGTDLTGYTVVAVDGDIGHVEATYNRRPAYLEVEAGSFFGRAVTLPAGLVERIDSTEKRVYVDRTRDQIKDRPGTTKRSPTTSTIGSAWVAITPARTCLRVIRCDLERARG